MDINRQENVIQTYEVPGIDFEITDFYNCESRVFVGKESRAAFLAELFVKKGFNVMWDPEEGRLFYTSATHAQIRTMVEENPGNYVSWFMMKKIEHVAKDDRILS